MMHEVNTVPFILPVLSCPILSVVNTPKLACCRERILIAYCKIQDLQNMPFLNNDGDGEINLVLG